MSFKKRRERRERYRCRIRQKFIFQKKRKKNTKIKITFTPLPAPSLLYPYLFTTPHCIIFASFFISIIPNVLFSPPQVLVAFARLSCCSRCAHYFSISPLFNSLTLEINRPKNLKKNQKPKNKKRQKNACQVFQFCRF